MDFKLMSNSAETAGQLLFFFNVSVSHCKTLYFVLEHCNEQKKTMPEIDRPLEHKNSAQIKCSNDVVYRIFH